MRLDILDTRETLEECSLNVFNTEANPRTNAFFLAVSMVVDLYRFRHEGPVMARRNEAIELLTQQIERSRHTAKHKFTEEDDLARRAMMFAHKSDLLGIISSRQTPNLSMEGFAEEADLSSATLNSHMSYTRRQYLFTGILKAAACIKGP